MKNTLYEAQNITGVVWSFASVILWKTSPWVICAAGYHDPWSRFVVRQNQMVVVTETERSYMNCNGGPPSQQAVHQHGVLEHCGKQDPTYHKNTKWGEIVLRNVAGKHPKTGWIKALRLCWRLVVANHLSSLNDVFPLICHPSVAERLFVAGRGPEKEKVNEEKLYIRKHFSKGKSTLNHLVWLSWWACPTKVKNGFSCWEQWIAARVRSTKCLLNTKRHRNT